MHPESQDDGTSPKFRHLMAGGVIPFAQLIRNISTLLPVWCCSHASCYAVTMGAGPGEAGVIYCRHLCCGPESVCVRACAHVSVMSA